MTDMINHPPHYAGVTIEPIDICERYPFALGCAIKYLARAGMKEGVSELEDMKKARWYLERCADYGIPPVLFDAFGSSNAQLRKFDRMIELLFEKNVYLARLFGLEEDGWHFAINKTRVRNTLYDIEERIEILEEDEEDIEEEEY